MLHDKTVQNARITMSPSMTVLRVLLSSAVPTSTIIGGVMTVPALIPHSLIASTPISAPGAG
jgi:hypothetical protein